MIQQPTSYEEHRRAWLERDALKEWVESRPGVLSMLKDIQDRVGPLIGMRILDAGCKEGWTGDCILARYPGQIQVQSVELLPKFVMYANNLGRSHVIEGDICHLPEGWTGMFDLVICRHVIGLVESMESAFKELHRVSKRWVYIITHIPGNERKHYQCLETEDELRALLDLVDADVVFLGPNPAQFRYKDARRVEYIILTKVRNPFSFYGP